MNTILKILFCTVLFFSCKKDDAKPKGIEFYLLENPQNVKSCEDFDASSQNILPTPLITDDDILSYDWKEHNLILKESAYTKLKNYRDEKKVAIYPLVLTVNGQKIYGLFYKYAILAQGCRSTLISENDFGPTDGKMEYSIVHGQGFGASTLGKDPRGDKRIYDYLKSTGRLVE